MPSHFVDIGCRDTVGIGLHGLAQAERRALLKDLALAPAWMHTIYHELAELQKLVNNKQNGG